MDECIICLDPCTEKMSCCNVHMHVACMCSILEKGFNKCPHCQKEMYPQPQPQPPPPTQYIQIPMPVSQYVEVDRTKVSCRQFGQGIGYFCLLMLGMQLMSQLW